MKTTLILVIVCGLMNPVFCQQFAENADITDVDNSFGILELFDGVPLYGNRSSSEPGVVGSTSYYMPIDESGDALIITKNIEKNSFTIKGEFFLLTLKRSKKDNSFTVKSKSTFKYSIWIKILNDGSFQLFFSKKSYVYGVTSFMYHYELAGLGIKLTYFNKFNKKEWTRYYETKDEHEKTSNPYPIQKDPRIISIGETARCWNSIFRFAAVKGDEIEIITTNERDIGKAYLSLYSSDGEIIKETEGKDILTLSFKIPEDGFYYISTIRDSDDDYHYLSITLNLKN